ncbi:MAG: PAS domain-containing sensor histidine kinase [Anaerolineae bacterium]|nr:PAS domain-containing sensor histidine kinase [Anaerolineae bacterium]
MQPFRARLWPFLRNLWTAVTDPSASVSDAQERRNARLLAALLSLSIGLLLFGRVFRGLTGVYEPPFQVFTVWINIAILSIAYILSRTKRHRLGAALAVSLVSAVVFLQVMYRGYAVGGDLSNPAVWLVALLLLSSFVISWQATIALSVANVAGLVMLPRLFPSVTFFDVRFSVEIIFALSLVIAMASYVRRRDWQRMAEQTETISENEDRYRTLFAGAFDGVVVHDEGTVIDLNDTLLALFGYARDEMIGGNVLTFIPPEFHAMIFEKARDNIMAYELVGLRKDGSTFPMEVSVKRLMVRGKLLRMVAMRDITERKRLEADHIQFITERERGQVLRQFISDASHDLRQPLATMNTSLYLLRRKSGDLGDGARHLDMLDSQLAYLSRLLEDLFAMARLDEPELFMERVPLDIDQLMNRIVQEQRPLAADKGHQLTFEPTGNLPPVLADHVELRRALTHVVANALTYTGSGGRITVRTLRQDLYACVEVQDTGIGISPDDLPHIFKRFYRADLARQTETGGSGLGLAIAQKIIEFHSGSIDVESTPGTGSTFRVCLPLATQSRAG